MRDWRLRLGRPNLEINARTVTHEEINRIYVGSKVCLNIHMGQSIGAPNPRNFEILGSGGTLLTDRDLSVLEGYESGKGFVRYTDRTSMRERAKELTEDEELRKKVAEAGHSIAASRHTYVHRAKRILEDFGRL
jgi:spore maturation protein CgeB